MLNSLRALRSSQPPSVFSYYSLHHNHLTRNTCDVRFAQSTSEPNRTGSSDDNDNDMEHKQEPKHKAADTMSSFGEGYATRSDEEGFGGVYGSQNQSVCSGSKEKEVSENPPDFDHSQGSEVKEKENSRHHNKADS